MKHTILIASIIMVLIASFAFAEGQSEKHFSFIAGGEFQTQDGFGDLPFAGYSLGVSAKVYDNMNNNDLWVRALFEQSWQFKISDPEASPRNYTRTGVSIGPEFVYVKESLYLGFSPGLAYRLTDYSTGIYDSEYGVYIEGFAQIGLGNSAETAWCVFQPCVNLKYFFGGAFEIGIGLRFPIRFF